MDTRESNISEALIAPIMSVRETSPTIKPCLSTTQTLCTCFVTAFSITSARGDSRWQTTSSLPETFDALNNGEVETISVNSRALRDNHVLNAAKWQPLKSVEENVPISFLPLPCARRIIRITDDHRELIKTKMGQSGYVYKLLGIFFKGIGAYDYRNSIQQSSSHALDSIYYFGFTSYGINILVYYT